jgi:hypothetical protein
MIRPQQDDGFPKREPRKPVDLLGFARHPWGDFTQVRLSNLSYTGCEIRTPEQMRRGDTFELRVARRGVIKAQVCWTGLQRAGCKFMIEGHSA